MENFEAQASPERIELLRETREFRDAEGKLIGTALLEFAPQEVEKSKYVTTEGAPGRCRRLMSFKLEGERDGARIETDLLGLAKAGETEIWIGTTRLKNYYSDAENGYVTAPPLETPIDVAILLHELGHADQSREDRFRFLHALPKGEETLRIGELERLTANLAQVRAAFPEAGAAIDRIDLQMLEASMHRADDVLGALMALGDERRQVDGQKDDLLRDTSQEAFDDEDEGLQELIARLHDAPETERAAMLEEAGFEFSPEAAPLPPSAKSMTISFGEERPAPSAMPREAVASYDIARHLLSAFMQAGADDLESVDERSGLLTLKLTITVGAERRFARLKIAARASEVRALKAGLRSLDAKEASLQRRVEALETEREAIKKEYNAQLDAQGIPALAHLGRNVLERDATRRAFLWMRTLRDKGGVDLFAKTSGAKENLQPYDEEGACAPSVTEGLAGPEAQDLLISDAKAYLHYALSTYDAKKFRLKDPDDEADIGVMPRPGSDRK